MISKCFVFQVPEEGVLVTHSPDSIKLRTLEPL